LRIHPLLHEAIGSPLGHKESFEDVLAPHFMDVTLGML